MDYPSKSQPAFGNLVRYFRFEFEGTTMEGTEKPVSALEIEKDLNDWLSVTKSRNGTWWHSAFHNVSAMVGAGILGLPYALSELGW